MIYGIAIALVVGIGLAGFALLLISSALFAGWPFLTKGGPFCCCSCLGHVRSLSAYIVGDRITRTLQPTGSDKGHR